MPAEKKQKDQSADALKILFSWKSPSRLFKKRSKEFFSTILTIVALVIIILIFLKEWFFALALIALTFLVFVLEKTPPETIEHKITNKGIETGGQVFVWEEVRRFWVEEKKEGKILKIEVLRPPFVLSLVLGPEEKKVRQIISSFVPEEAPEKTWLDKASVWLVEKFPLE